ncbi:Oxo-4-hydroxy-4-carboxy-5-ureidoimidazoline decarboxylase [Penicillium paradoxum]|uniref:Oxo-4-hydroxy-4-carboxy-5-ureidoimidazoline decarboxylase n=1 Tax=Penicillium paradoxum TaxID=176176 RepID=UPI002549AEB5|nr:Oxo-4-hydroxy-4-carboxy-5-ureidoimidazoline decarboxylase [Penicillium paradoxum]KAJ5782486.1 Oxo-4-hydroxy-4-carboxy-5-ureidoimidazoline decarboxylase [Penicillium paradoxum]
MADLPPLSTIPSLPRETQLRVLDTLFEPSPELHRLMIPVLANQTFSSYTALIDAVGGRMSALSAPDSPTDRDVLFGILGSHPRLGRAPTNPEHLSELSKKEQAQLNEGAEEQAEKLRALNAEYEEKFPGLRFVTFVNGRSRDVIMVEMRQRIDRANAEKEIEETIQGSDNLHLRVATTPAIAEPPLRASTFPNSALSDVASGSAHSLHDARNTRRSPIIGGPVRASTTNTFYETRTESSAIDPLSQHIIQRTNTQKSIPLKLLGKASYEAEAVGSDYSQPEQGSAPGDSSPISKPSKEKKKGVSFLSRIIGTKKKDQVSDAEDEISEPEAGRMSIDTSNPIGFIPRHPAPSKYLKVRAHYKKDKTFDRVFLAQELEGSSPSPQPADRRISGASALTQNGENTGKAVWALLFSKDGKYLAAAGQDRKVRVWAVISTPEEREDADRDEEATPVDAQEHIRLSAPVFQPEPIQVYEGHTGSILDLSWSKNNFLLSSSMDKTVRLWHISRPECLCCFQHSDFVTSIQFHPRDDRFFLAGSLDTKLRLWSIPDKSVAFVTAVPDMITAVAFTPDGKYSIAGCLNGMLNIYDTEGLRVSAQIHVRSARGRNSKGSKITGIDTMVVPKNDSPGDTEGDIKLLVTSNDSRIRLYNFQDRTLQAKFRGNENTCSQIRATFTDDGKHIICGSEDRRAYVWPIASVERDSERRAVEVFETQSAIVTAAITAPVQTKQVLALSEDPIYDICNPPPVALVGPDAANSSSRPGSGRGIGETHKRSFSTPRFSIISKMAHESPSYLARSKHPGGDIIVIADYSGKIKILRQDCAYQKRRFENWHVNSTISRRILGRSDSARRSTGSSIGKESSHKTPSERIISWRNSVVRHGRSSTEGSRPGLRTRSPSPQHRQATFKLTSSRPSSLGPNESLSGFTTSPPASPHRARLHSTRNSEEMSRTNGNNNTIDSKLASNAKSATEKLATCSADLLASGNTQDNPLWLQGDHSYVYWNKITHDALAMRSRHSGDLLRPDSNTQDRRVSMAGSILSSDCTSSMGDAEDDLRKCDKCRGTSFRSVKGRDGKQKLICSECLRPVS